VNREVRLLKEAWSILVAAAAVAAAIDIPAQLLLGYRARPEAISLDCTFSLIFLIDMLLHAYGAGWFRRPRTGTARPYPTGWLLIDVIAVIPFAVFAAQSPLQLLRLLKLARVAQHTWHWQRAAVHYPTVTRLSFFFFWLALSAHWIACGWLALRGVSAECSGATNYVCALYWCVTTLTTVGYGDITPFSNAEMLYTMLAMVLGVGVYGYVIGNVAGVLANIDPARVRHRELVGKVTAFMRYRGVPARLQRRILDYYEHLWEKRLGYDESAAISGLPPALRTEVSLFLNRDIIEKVPLFQGAKDDFVRAVVLELRPAIFLPGDYIMRAGESGEQMYFISKGTVEVVSADGKQTYATLTDGDFVGEIALLLGTPRTASVRAMDYCDLYTLTRASLDHVLARHPDVAARIQAIAKQRHREIQERHEREAKESG